MSLGEFIGVCWANQKEFQVVEQVQAKAETESQHLVIEIKELEYFRTSGA